MTASRTATPPPTLQFPEATLRVEPWLDPTVDALGYETRSLYVEQFWVAVLGPTATLLIRRLGAELERHPDGFEIDSAQWAIELGLGIRGGKNGPFWRALDRLARFGAVRRAGAHVGVRRNLPPLTARQTARLPAELAARHDALLKAQLERQRVAAALEQAPTDGRTTLDIRAGSKRTESEPTAPERTKPQPAQAQRTEPHVAESERSAGLSEVA